MRREDLCGELPYSTCVAIQGLISILVILFVFSSSGLPLLITKLGATASGGGVCHMYNALCPFSNIVIIIHF